MKSFTESQFTYCPLVWIYYDKTSDYRINHLHERALKTVYNGNISTFEKLLEKDHSAAINVKNLTTGLYKAAPIMH